MLSGERPRPKGGRVLHEIAWTPQEDGAVRQHWRYSEDGGETWKDAFLGIYRQTP